MFEKKIVKRIFEPQSEGSNRRQEKTVHLYIINPVVLLYNGLSESKNM